MASGVPVTRGVRLFITETLFSKQKCRGKLKFESLIHSTRTCQFVSVSRVGYQVNVARSLRTLSSAPGVDLGKATKNSHPSRLFIRRFFSFDSSPVKNSDDCDTSRDTSEEPLPHENVSNHSEEFEKGGTDIDPFMLVQEDVRGLSDTIQDMIRATSLELQEISRYHFDGQGKSFRPVVVMLLARAVNKHNGHNCSLMTSQKNVAMIAEMIHTASLVHDDVIDLSDTRRGKPSVHKAWGARKAICSGDFILSQASMELARIRNTEVVQILSQVLEDLVKGEFMQLGSKEDESERFNHYLKKTYKKTASLISCSCRAVAVLSDSSEDVVENAFQYGRNIGIAFQLVDDLLDFTSSENLMGKPTAADLRLGLATAPVLFAAHQFPELNPMIMRRFTVDGDVELARELVAKSDGVSHTRYLAQQHCKEAVRQLRHWQTSPETQGLIELTQRVLNRYK